MQTASRASSRAGVKDGRLTTCTIQSLRSPNVSFTLSLKVRSFSMKKEKNLSRKMFLAGMSYTAAQALVAATSDGEGVSLDDALDEALQEEVGGLAWSILQRDIITGPDPSLSKSDGRCFGVEDSVLTDESSHMMNACWR